MARPTLPPAAWREAVWRWAMKASQRREARPHETLLLTHRGLRDMLRLSQRRVYMPMPTPPMPLWLNDPHFDDQADLANLGHIGHLGDLSNNMQWRIPDLRYTEQLPPAPPAWQAAARGWCVAALLLAAILMLVRLTEKCLDSRIFGSRRRRGIEWPTPNVLATSNRGNDLWHDPTSDPDMLDPYSDNSEVSNDFPPPYSQCSNVGPNGEPKPPEYTDEPPPPYSACYVAFTNPKDGTPTVQFLNDRRDNAFGDSSLEHVDTGQIDSNDAANRDQRVEIERIHVNTERSCVNDVDEVSIGIPSTAILDDNVRRENISIAI